MKTIQPYELLVRWSEVDGSLKAYHLKTITIYTDDQTGETWAKEGEPMTATEAEAAGFPLASILDKTTAEALKSADAATKALAELQGAKP